MAINVDYLGKIGYIQGELRHGFLINMSQSMKNIKNKKIILLGAAENSIYAEMLLKNNNIKVVAYADNSENVCGNVLRGKKIYSPYELFEDRENYFIITVNYNIATVRLQLLAYGIRDYSIFLNHRFHDFYGENDELQNALMDAINIVCFKDEDTVNAMPYIPESGVGVRNELGRLNYLLYSTLWSHWAYLWLLELLKSVRYEILEIGPGYGLMSCILLKLFPDIHIDWLLMKGEVMTLEESEQIFNKGLNKVKKMYKDRIDVLYGILEREDLPDKKYGLIILTEVFEHFVVNPINTMKKLCDRLISGGKVILTTPNWGRLPIFQSWKDLPLETEISENRYNELLNCGHVYQYSKNELIEVFAQAGFSVEKYHLSDSNNHNFLLVKV